MGARRRYWLKPGALRPMLKWSPTRVHSKKPRSSGPDRSKASRNSWKLHPCRLMSVVRSQARSKTRVAGQIQKLSVVAGASGKDPLQDVVEVQQEAAGIGRRWFEGDGVHGVVVPAHRVVVSVRPDRLGNGRSGVHAAARGSARPVPTLAPARAKAIRCCPLAARHRTLAEWASSRPIARPTERKPGPVVTCVRSLMVKNAGPIGSVVFAIATSGRYGTGTMAGNAGRAPLTGGCRPCGYAAGTRCGDCLLAGLPRICPPRTR